MPLGFRSPALATLALLAVSMVSRGAGAAPAPWRTPPNAVAAVFDSTTRMDVNQLDMVATNFGSIAYDPTTVGNGGLIYPKGTLQTVVYAAGLWLGAKVDGGTRVALGEYMQEFTPGPMRNGTFQPDQPAFHSFKFSRTSPLSGSDLQDYLAQGGPADSTGQAQVLGDETIWSVYNDANPALHTNVDGSTSPLGVEVQQTVYAFNRTGALGNTIFVRWKLLNKGGHQLDSTRVTIWSDPDLGSGNDDLVGCDTTLALGYCYNATNADLVYGSHPPAVGFTLLNGPVPPGAPATAAMTSFQIYIGGSDPQSADETYCLMSGRHLDGSPLHILNDPSLPVTSYAVSGLNPGSPSTATNWLDSNPSDRRMMINTGPFTMAPGDSQVIDFAICVGGGADRLSSIAVLRSYVTLLRSSFVPTAVQAAVVTIEPQTIRLGAEDPWLTATIEPSGFDVASIVPGSVLLGGAVHPDPGFAVYGDRDGNGRLDLTLRFAREAVDPLLTPGDVRLELTGSLASGDRFEGVGTVLVIGRPGGGLRLTTGHNPFQPSGTLRFTTTRSGAVRLRIFDTGGRLVRTLVQEASYAAGAHEVAFDGRNAASRALPAGIYWARVDTDEGAATASLVLLR